MTTLGKLPCNLHVCHRPRGNGIVLVMSPEPNRRVVCAPEGAPNLVADCNFRGAFNRDPVLGPVMVGLQK
jgi:hypothetical protein